MTPQGVWCTVYPLEGCQVFTEQLTQALALPVASLYPANYAFDNANARIVGPVNMRIFRRILAHVLVGVVAANSNVQAFFQSSNANNGTFANVPGGPTLGAAGVNTSNTEYTLEMRADQVPAGNNWVQLGVLVNVANSFVAASLYCGESSYKPASAYNANTTVLPQQNVM